jgi:hypothetical protein
MTELFADSLSFDDSEEYEWFNESDLDNDQDDDDDRAYESLDRDEWFNEIVARDYYYNNPGFDEYGPHYE